ncbi:MAG TPA: hypothetical protein VIG66_00515 [Noviherbaspirillum sp.]
MTMSCVDGSQFQCSGDKVLRIENGVALTDSGVQVYGISTSDLLPNNPSLTQAYGLRPAEGGPAEVRVARDENGSTSKIYMLLRNLGLRWDAVNERPPIVETFTPTQGRVQLAENGAVSFLPLPPSSDLSFYDYANLGRSGTQANYANNRYFPRENNPARCPSGQSCAEIETTGVGNGAPGEWRTGGLRPDQAGAIRVHSDGDIHAGDGKPDANGNRTWLEGGTGFGVPFPASKGYRDLSNWSYGYANLATWTTQDTVEIAEWSTNGQEHNKMRRGVVSFGDVTAPTQVPSSGSMTYRGIAYGWYAADENVKSPRTFWGSAEVTVNFATGLVTVAVQNTTTYDADSLPLPVALTSTLTTGSVATNSSNYMTGTASTGVMNGGISARYYGPPAAAANGVTSPPEIGGTFTLSGPSTESVIGGFIAYRQ